LDALANRQLFQIVWMPTADKNADCCKYIY